MNTFDSETHTYSIGGRIVPSVTQALKSVGIIDDRFYTDEKKIRGTFVHDACQFFDEDCLDWESLDSRIRPYVEAYQKFKEQTGFVPRLIEQPVFNETHLYAGTLDRCGELAGDDVLLDLKSGAIEPWAALQTAGYDLCFPKRRKRFALKLEPDGNYQLIPFKERSDGNVFLSIVAAVHWKNNNLKTKG